MATGGELEACLRGGARPEIIAFHGNNKSDEELDLAVGAGIGFVIVDNPDELERLDRAARDARMRQPTLLRILPGVDPHTHQYVDTGGTGSKFGTPTAEGLALQAIKLATTLPAIDLRGLHAHVGSQVLDEGPFLETVDVLLDLASEARDAIGFQAYVLDVGGGFGAVYTDEAVPDPAGIANAVLSHVKEGAARRSLPVPDLMVEPGRALAANPVLTLYRVGSVKRLPGGPSFVAVDGGMSDNIRPVLYGSRYTVRLAGREADGDLESFTIVGKHCESGDVLARDVALPADVSPGDLIAFAATGAYCYAMSSNYNRVGRPAVVGIAGDEIKLLLRREDVADLDRLETGQPPLPDVTPPEGITIRPAEPKDVGSFLDHLRSVAAERRFIATEEVEVPPRYYRRLARRPWTESQAWIMALEGDRVVGSLRIGRENRAGNTHIASLGMAVTADRRGRGVGSALLAEAFRWADQMGIEKVSLTVYPHNTVAVSLYRKFGFVDEGRLRGQSKKSYGYEDEVIMSRWLA